MDDEIQEDKCPSRYRSPSFSKEEVNSLLNLIEKYKIIILNKSITSEACQAKETTWTKIAKHFNSQELGHTRTTDNLRVKWENMKRDARRLSKNLSNSSCSEMDALNARIITMISEAENVGAIDYFRDGLHEDFQNEDIENYENGTGEQKTPSKKFWNENNNCEDEDEQTEKSLRLNRALNFSPQECYVLLQCAKKEKKHLFSKEISSRAIELKNSAWARITDNYNKLSPQKRSTKVLKTKFTNMKGLAKKVGFKDYFKDIRNKGIHKNDSKDIKKEPMFENKLDQDSDSMEDVDNTEFNELKPDHNYVEVQALDPLSAVLNGDSGLESSSSNVGSWNLSNSENKEVVKLKLELLKYQMETAKLERKRIEDALASEALEREARATETALRVRAARLSAVEAALRLPPAHPALAFTPEEARAEHYLNQYQH